MNVNINLILLFGAFALTFVILTISYLKNHPKNKPVKSEINEIPGISEPDTVGRQKKKPKIRGRAVDVAPPMPLPLTPLLGEIFSRDALKTIAVLEDIHEKNGVYKNEDIRMYTINVHAIKSALINIGETELSAVAGKLEKAGRDKDAAVMSSETPAFIDELRALIKKIEKLENLTPPKEERETDEAALVDYPYLCERLLAVEKACETYDKKTVKYALIELRQKEWPSPIKELLAAMAKHLHNGDFEEVSRITEMIEKIHARYKRRTAS
ncbi:MAG: hypothetical protein FWG71_02265 [Synergistaceae bacterium]|nr:hypothetical protein [Synergistaceae bacterium]